MSPGAAVRAVLASAEFAVTVLFGAVLYAWCAIYFGVCMYLNEMRGLLARAVVLWRFRVAAVAANETPKRVIQHKLAGRGRFESWLN